MSLYIEYTTEKANCTIYLPREMKGLFKVNPHKLILHIGSWKKEVSVRFSAEIPEDRIGIPKGVLEGFSIPQELNYEVRIDNRNIYIGPIIAYVAVFDEISFTQERLEKFSEYMLSSDEISGLIYLCASKSINIMEKNIEGFYFKPGGTGGSSWTKGVFPYPGAMYRKTDIPRNIYDDLINVLGDKIFNGYFFDKWDLWDYLSPYPELCEYLPSSIKLENLNSLDAMLDQFGSVYLKKRNSYKAKGIIKAHRAEDGYHFLYRLKGEYVYNKREAEKFVQDLIDESYFIQQTVNLKQYEDRNYDFRVILQKGYSARWECSGIIARFGKVGSIATNFILEGYALTGLDALQRVFELNDRDAFIKEQEIIEVCSEICSALDRSAGNYGDLGIDVMIDENMKVWVLEVNKLHDHRYPIYSINDLQMYYRVITTPFHYAKKLAGF